MAARRQHLQRRRRARGQGHQGGRLGDLSFEHVADAVDEDEARLRGSPVFVSARARSAGGRGRCGGPCDLNRLADVENLGGVVDVAQRKLRDVSQAVNAVEVNEGAEVDDAQDASPSTTWPRSRQ